MRWFKHFTKSWDDEDLASITAEYGLEIYGFWWRLLEIIGKQMDDSPRTHCRYPVKTWGKFAGVSSGKFRKLADVLEEKKLIILKNDGDEIMINVPNMLKFKDEWSSRRGKNSGVARE